MDLPPGPANLKPALGAREAKLLKAVPLSQPRSEASPSSPSGEPPSRHQYSLARALSLQGRPQRRGRRSSQSFSKLPGLSRAAGHPGSQAPAVAQGCPPFGGTYCKLTRKSAGRHRRPGLFFLCGKRDQPVEACRGPSYHLKSTDPHTREQRREQWPRDT